MMLKTELRNAKQSISGNRAGGCFSQRCQCDLWNKSLPLFNLLRRPLGKFAPTVSFFLKMPLFCSKLEFTLEKRCMWSLLASRPVILKWRRDSLLTDAREGFLQKALTMNRFCCAVISAIFLSLDFFHSQQIRSFDFKNPPLRLQSVLWIPIKKFLRSKYKGNT